jgi:DNA-binding LacI/PurR family transcriptional regulator
MRKRVTSTDIARRIGVSRTTVSFVLNNVPGVAVETRARVLEAAKKLGYVPNSAARMLVSGRSYTLGLIISRADLLCVDAFIPQLIYGIGGVCNERGYKLLVESVEGTSNADAYLDLVYGKRIDALMIVNPQRNDKGLLKLVEMRFPVVSLGSLHHTLENSVSVDDVAGARAATEHLISLGHRRIAYIGYAPLSYLAATARFAGYKKALREQKISVDRKLIASANFSSESGFHAMKRIIGLNTDVTAVFISNDTVALGAMAAIREAGLTVPDDIAVVGFDDLPFSSYTNPPLTTIQSDPAGLGEFAARAALKLLDGERVGVQRNVVPLKLVVRESCGARSSN